MTRSNPLLSAYRALCTADPAAPAVIEAETTRMWTRAALLERAEQLAMQLPPIVTRRRVILAGANGAEWLARLLALWHQDAIAIPVDPTEPAARQEELAAMLRAVAIWSGDEIQLRPGRQVADRTADLIKLTSGSTGLPRPLRFTATQVQADGEQVCTTMEIRPMDLNLGVIPFGHSYGLGNLVVPLLRHGTAILIPRSPLPRILAEDCAHWRPTVFPAVPALLRLLSQAEPHRAAFPSWRTVISAGAPLAPEIAEQIDRQLGHRVHGFYGSSETGGISYDRTGEATLRGRSVGTPLTGVTITPRSSGRIWVESAAVHTLGNRQCSERGLGRFSPADRVEILASGELALRGRTGRLVKIAGRRIDLGEVERELRRCAQVTDAFASVHPTQPDELAAAAQTMRPERELRAELASQLPAWKVPRRLLCLPAFPLTDRGKIDVAGLKRLLTGEPRPRSDATG